MRLRFRRGQEEAPIELLIAVTVLTFVLIIGLYAYNNACAAQFEHKMKSSLSGFARTLEQIYQGGVGTSYPTVMDFSPIGCPSGDIESVRLVEGLEAFCNVRLGVDECLMLAVRIRGRTLEEEIFIAEAVNIPPLSAEINYEDNTRNLICTFSDWDPDAIFDDFGSKDFCGWGLQRYVLTLEKTPSGINIVQG